MITILLLLVLNTPVIAISSYLGIGVQEYYQNFDLPSDSPFRTTLPMAKVFLGLDLSKTISLELGYETTKRKSNTVIKNPGDEFIGYTIPFGMNNSRYLLNSKYTNIYIDLIKKKRLADFATINFLLGVSWQNNQLSLQLKDYFLGTMFMNPNEPELKLRNHSKKLAPRFGVGIEKRIGKNCGIKLNYTYTYNSLLGNYKNKDDSGAEFSSRLRAARQFSLSFYSYLN